MATNNAMNNSGQVPIGMIVAYAYAAPTDWFLCDGASKDTTTYAALFAVIAYTYGGSGANFTLPTASGYIIRYQ